MDRSEITERYLQGQVSRRVFIRRMIASGVSAMAAIAYADVLVTNPAAAAAGDFYIFVFDYGFSPTPALIGAQGRRVEWGFSSGASHHHSVTDSSGMRTFDSGFKAPGSAFFKTFIAAGHYPYRCKETTHPFAPMNGLVRVPIMVSPQVATVGSEYTITWASQAAPAGFVFDVQIKRPGQSSFQNWKVGARLRRGKFAPGVTGVFKFRGRLRKLRNGAWSDYSPPARIRVN